MTAPYNAIAGQNLHRLEALSDGVFAVAMTLLVLDLHAPAAHLVHSEGQLGAALENIAPNLLTYLMSFLTLGIFWVGQQTHHSFLSHSDRAYSWINIVFLMLICLVPFSTSLLSEFIEYRLALVFYWLNLLAIGFALAAASYRARNFGLVKKDVPPDFEKAVMRRIIAGQVLYALGAALCVFSPYWSIGFIVAVQLMFAIGPRFKPFAWI